MARLKELELTQLVGEMTTSMIGVGVAPGGDALASDAQTWIGCVHLSDDHWSGTVLVSMERGGAERATAAMFMLGDDEVDDELVGDAMGEFANVLAGMIKTEIGGGCTLSLPSVTAGSGLRFAVPGTSVVDQQHFACDVGDITITTLETT